MSTNQPSGSGIQDLLARLDADFALLIGAVSRMMESLKKLLGGYARQDAVQASKLRTYCLAAPVLAK